MYMDAALPRRRSPQHAADQMTIPAEEFLMQSVSQPVIGTHSSMSKTFTEPRADPSRTNPSSHPSSHRTDAYTRRAALAQDTSEKSRTRVRDYDAKMHPRWKQPRARFGAAELMTEVMTLRVHAEISMLEAGQEQSEIPLGTHWIWSGDNQASLHLRCAAEGSGSSRINATQWTTFCLGHNLELSYLRVARLYLRRA